MIYSKGSFCVSTVFVYVLFLMAAALPYMLFAQEIGLGVGRTIVVATSEDGPGVAFGDIVSFHRPLGVYHLAQVTADENILGVAVELPAVVLETETGGIPVVENGEVSVNVTLFGGPISVGDLVTSSPIPGKGQRAADTDIYVLGVALEDFNEESTSTLFAYNDQTVSVGTIPVSLFIGPRQDALEQINEDLARTVGEAEAAQLNVLRHIIAAVIAVGSVYFAFRNFGSNVRTGIHSIGRNPRAKRSIQSVVLFNIVLIILVSIIGLFTGLAIILLPL